MATEHERINADSAYLVGLVEKYLPESVTDSLAGTAQCYAEEGLFDVTALTEENVQYTIDFFINASLPARAPTATPGCPPPGQAGGRLRGHERG